MWGRIARKPKSLFPGDLVEFYRLHTKDDVKRQGPLLVVSRVLDEVSECYWAITFFNLNLKEFFTEYVYEDGVMCFEYISRP